MEYHVGMVFSTPFEDNCIVKSLPDKYGNFVGIDSEGEECAFITEMVHFISPRCKACQDRLMVLKLLLAVYGNNPDKTYKSLMSEIRIAQDCDPSHTDKMSD